MTNQVITYLIPPTPPTNNEWEEKREEKRTEERVKKWAEKHIIYPPFLKLSG
ncbi:hypothetical protein UF75_2856 [Desulfosporosinus sp. I2]|nr:hypothetical protein UF75_2856 [Desulfosporosinus sp. I2]